MKNKNDFPVWVTKGKSIRQLIKELKSFEDQDLEVRITLDDAKTNYPVSILTRRKKGPKYFCMIENAELAFTKFGESKIGIAKGLRQPKEKTKRSR